MIFNSTFEEEEKWEFIPNYEGLYQVSNMGRIRSVSRIVFTKAFGGTTLTVNEKFLKQDLANGYLRVTLSSEGKTKRFLVHVLVAILFIPNPNNLPNVNHKKGIKTDNRASQLEWCTKSENEKHAYRFLGKVASMAKAVLDTNTGIFYESITQAAVAKNIKPKKLLSIFYRDETNKTGLIRV